jgi:hypothetical protein
MLPNSADPLHFAKTEAGLFFGVERMRLLKSSKGKRGWSKKNSARTFSALTKRGGSINRKSDAQLDREVNAAIAAKRVRLNQTPKA